MAAGNKQLMLMGAYIAVMLILYMGVKVLFSDALLANRIPDEMM